jgi:hypothetical protein
MTEQTRRPARTELSHLDAQRLARLQLSTTSYQFSREPLGGKGRTKKLNPGDFPGLLEAAVERQYERLELPANFSASYTVDSPMPRYVNVSVYTPGLGPELSTGINERTYAIPEWARMSTQTAMGIATETLKKLKLKPNK